MLYGFEREVIFKYQKEISDSNTTAFIFLELYCKHNKIKTRNKIK